MFANQDSFPSDWSADSLMPLYPFFFFFILPKKLDYFCSEEIEGVEMRVLQVVSLTIFAVLSLWLHNHCINIHTIQITDL